MNEPGRKRLPLRWLTLAEIVGVIALAIAGLSYWDSHRDRLAQEKREAVADRERAAQAKAQGARERAESAARVQKLAFLLTGTPDGAGDRIALQPAHPEQVVQTQTLWFPIVVRADRVETTGNPRIEAGWFEAGLRKAAGKAQQGRVPVAIETRFIEDGETKTDRSVYAVGYSFKGRLVGGPKLRLDGLSLSRRNVSGDPQAAADGMWIAR